MKLFLSILLLFNISIASSENTEPETTVEIKKGGAIIAFSKEDGFKLSTKAQANLGVEFEKVKGSGPWVVPLSSLVKVKHVTGVYRRWENWITMVLVEVIRKNGNTAQIKSVDLESGDEIAISGVPFLRMTEADLNSDTVDACAH